MSKGLQPMKLGEIIAVFLGSTVGLALTPSIISNVETAVAAMPAGAAKTLMQLLPLFWVIFLMALPVGSSVLYIKGKLAAGTMTIMDILSTFIPMILGGALTPTVQEMVTNATVNMTAGASKTMLLMFPLFWVIYLLGIPVTAIATYFYVKTH